MPVSEEINTSSWTEFSVLISIKIRHSIFIASIEYPLNLKLVFCHFCYIVICGKKQKKKIKMKVKFALENELNHIFNVKNDIEKFRNQMIVMVVDLKHID